MVRKFFYYILPFAILTAYVGYTFYLSGGISQISTDELANMLANESGENMFYLDVREQHEYSDGHIQEMTNVPLSQLEKNVHMIPRDKTVVIICRSGSRSMEAASILKEVGYKDIINVKGGMLDWNGELIK